METAEVKAHCEAVNTTSVESTAIEIVWRTQEYPLTTGVACSKDNIVTTTIQLGPVDVLIGGKLNIVFDLIDDGRTFGEKGYSFNFVVSSLYCVA